MPPSPQETEKFRLLKKALQQTFRHIRQAARDGALPEARHVKEFATQVEIMVSYAGFGDAAYPQLLAACARLTACSAQADPHGVHEAVAAIIVRQHQCHGQFAGPRDTTPTQGSA